MQTPLSSSKPARPSARPGERPRSLLAREPVLLLAVLLAAFYFGRPILIPIALSLTFAFLLTPLVTRLERMRLSRVPATLVVLVAATALLGFVIWLVAGQLLTVVNGLPDHAANIRAKLTGFDVPANSSLGRAVVSLEGLSREFSSGRSDQLAKQQQLADQQQLTKAVTTPGRSRGHTARQTLPTAADQAAVEAPQPQPVFVVQAPATELAYLRELARPVFAPLGATLMVLVFTVYMLIKREDLRNRLLLLAGISRLNLVSHALDDAGERISRYLIANVSVNAGIGAVFAAGLYAIGIPYAILWGALLALLRTIPYVGVLIGGGVPTLFALIYFPAWWEAGCTFALIALLEILVSNFLEPRLYGAHTGISELALLVMAIVWTLLWGWPGLLLSTPLTVCVIVVGRTMPQMSFLHILLGDDAELAPEARFYERMLALDQREAQRIIDRFLEQRPASTAVTGRGPAPTQAANTSLDLYDTVLLPALVLAESDRHKGTLEDHRAAFFMQGAAELISELTHQTRSGSSPAPLPLFDRAEGIAARPTPIRACCPVVCVPASDQADEIAATMLAQLLEAIGHKTLLLPPSALTAELIAGLARESQTTMCISAVPPFAFTAAQALYQRLREAMPANRILVCMWQSPTSPEQLRQRFVLAPGDTVATSLAAALETIRGSEPGQPVRDIFARASQQAALSAQ